jgi:dTMP kinase
MLRRIGVKGIFITFEGPDGAGKTTQIKSLAEALERDGYELVVTREPGGTKISDQIRSILLSPDHSEMVDQAEILLYAASRAQHVHEKIIPALKQNKIVLCDRYIDASIAYQAYGLQMDETIVSSISTFASSGIQPFRTYMLDITAEESRRRLKGRAEESQFMHLDRIELKELEYHRRVREGFLRISRTDMQRVLLLDANREAALISREIIKDCKRLLQQCSIQHQ